MENWITMPCSRTLVPRAADGRRYIPVNKRSMADIISALDESTWPAFDDKNALGTVVIWWVNST